MTWIRELIQRLMEFFFAPEGVLPPDPAAALFSPRKLL